MVGAFELKRFGLEIEERGAVGRAQTRMRGTAGSSELIRCQDHAVGEKNNNLDSLGATSR